MFIMRPNTTGILASSIAVLAMLGKCAHVPARHEPIVASEYALQGNGALATMSGNVRVVVLGLRAIRDDEMPFNLRQLAIDLLIEGPESDAIISGVVIKDHIFDDPTDFIEL